MRKSVRVLIMMVLAGLSSVFSATPPFYTVALDSAKNQLNRLATSMGANYTAFPRSINSNGTVATVAYSDWTSGFFPGSLWLMYQYTSDATWSTRARNWTNALQNAATVNDHDVGFRILCSYGTGLQFQTAAQYKSDTAVIMRAAKTLTGRYNGTVKAIKSWDTYTKNGTTYNYPVIIDNMMNLELLEWATRNSKDSSFGRIAVTHSNTTKLNHFRSNYSSYHLVAYDQSNGNVLGKMTVQGYSDASSWSRGQGWGLYGYTMMYRYTKDTAYLNQATHIADYIISRLPTDLVPYWDFDVPLSDSPSRDASAAAIYASALIELSTMVPGANGQAYYQKAKAILQSLASSTYTAAPSTNGNFILKHCTGNHPAGTEIDVPLNYADYYYLEALLRMKDIEETTAIRNSGTPSPVAQSNLGFTVEPYGSNKMRIVAPREAKGALIVRVCDLGGRVLMRQSFANPSRLLDLSSLPGGCYSVQISNGAETLYRGRIIRN